MKQLKIKALPPLPKKAPNYMRPRDQTIKTTSTSTNTLTLNTRPDPKYDNTHAIKWFRSKYNKTQISNSVNSLISYSTKGKDLMMMHRSRSYQPRSSQSPLNLDLKYLFQHSIYSKILKLRELFLDFDRDTNKMMEVGEIETMFKENNIKVTKCELISLFFKDIQYFNKANKKRKLYLTFNQFIDFCLSQDQEFRLFMRKIKQKNKINDLNQHFFPMNFNALLDYFLIKGEERKAKRKINSAICIMDKVVNSNSRVLITEVNALNNIPSTVNTSLRAENRFNDDIDFGDLLNEFEKLFVLTQSDIVKKKRAISAIAHQKVKMQPIQFKKCRNIFEKTEAVGNNKPIKLNRMHRKKSKDICDLESLINQRKNN